MPLSDNCILLVRVRVRMAFDCLTRVSGLVFSFLADEMEERSLEVTLSQSLSDLVWCLADGFGRSREVTLRQSLTSNNQ